MKDHKLRGILKVARKNRNGEIVTYYYYGRGGARILGDWGSPEFARSYAAARAASIREPDPHSFFSIIALYKGSPEFNRLADTTKKGYKVYISMIEQEFGDLTLSAVNDERTRATFLAWRDSFASTPRKADLAWAVLVRIISFGKHRGRLRFNVCERGGRLSNADRSEIIWNPDDLEAFDAVASDPLRQAVLIALWTGMRLGDLLTISWANIENDSFVLRPRKGARGSKKASKLTIRIARPLRPLIERLRGEYDLALEHFASNPRLAVPSDNILLNSRKLPWTVCGFESSFSAARLRAGLKDRGLHFHDLRGTAITRLAISGCTIPQIAAITGHSMGHVESIVERYVGRNKALSEAAITALERHYAPQIESPTRQCSSQQTDRAEQLSDNHPV